MAPITPKRVPRSASSSSDEDEEVTDIEEEHQHQQPPKEPAESESEPEEESEEEEEEEEEQQQQQQQQQVKNAKPSVPKHTPTTTKKNPQPNKEGEQAKNASVQKPTPITTTKNPQPNPSLDSDSGSDSDTHSGQNCPSPTASDFTIKPSKPTIGSSNSKKPTSISAAKRPLDSQKNPKESKKKKTKVEEEEKKSVCGGINRLWSEDDEVVILEGIIEFQSKKGLDPYSDTDEFLEFIKKSLSVEVSKNQLKDKVRRLKKKYENNSGKGEKGEDPVFLKPHEYKCFGLSKKIWGGGGKDSDGVDGNENGNGKSGSKRARKNIKVDNGVVLVDGFKEVKDIKVDKVEKFWSMYPCLKQSLDTPFDLSMKEPVKGFVMGNMSVIGNVKAKELEKKWKNLHLDEAALYLKRVELVNEQVKLAVDAMKASKD